MRLCAAIIFVLVGTAGLQTAQPDSNQDVTVSGCVAQAQRTGSLADDNGAGVAATPNTAPIDANSAEPVDAYLLTNATAAGTESEDPKRATPTSYTLLGFERELSQHKGHQVAITGKLLPPRASAEPSTKTTAPGIQRIAVASIKMLGTECKKPAQSPQRPQGQL